MIWEIEFNGQRHGISEEVLRASYNGDSTLKLGPCVVRVTEWLETDPPRPRTMVMFAGDLSTAPRPPKLATDQAFGGQRVSLGRVAVAWCSYGAAVPGAATCTRITEESDEPLWTVPETDSAQVRGAWTHMRLAYQPDPTALQPGQWCWPPRGVMHVINQIGDRVEMKIGDGVHIHATIRSGETARGAAIRMLEAVADLATDVLYRVNTARPVEQDGVDQAHAGSAVGPGTEPGEEHRERI